MQNNQSKKEAKRKFALWVKDSVIDLAKEQYKDDNCSSISEFIEKAIVFYSGYVSSGKNNSYLSSAITSSLKSIISESDNRHNRMLFKLCVETAMMMNVIATMQKISKTDLERLRGECVKEVKKLNGKFSFDDAVEWQQGE